MFPVCYICRSRQIPFGGLPLYRLSKRCPVYWGRQRPPRTSSQTTTVHWTTEQTQSALYSRSPPYRPRTPFMLPLHVVWYHSSIHHSLQKDFLTHLPWWPSSSFSWWSPLVSRFGRLSLQRHTPFGWCILILSSHLFLDLSNSFFPSQ
jgi:hypothetical protein